MKKNGFWLLVTGYQFLNNTRLSSILIFEILTKKKWAIITVSCLLFTISSTKAQFSISGKVTDAESGKILPGTTVILENSTRGTITNLQGFYNLKNLKTDTYVLKISYWLSVLK